MSTHGKMRSSILLLCIIGVMGENTPAPAPESGDTGNKQTVNVELIGRCCAPGRCNTDTTPTYTDPSGATKGSASDCAQYTDKNGELKTTVDWKDCKDPAECTDPEKSCGGYSETAVVPGELCSATSFGMICCVPGKAGKGSECAEGTNSGGDKFNSAGWQVCKYQTGCENAGNMCGGYNTAGIWVKAGKYADSDSDSPTPVPTGSPTPGQADADSTSTSTKKSSGGLSTGAIVGIAIGSLALVGIAMMMFTGSSDNSKNQEGYQMQGDDATYLPPSDAAVHQNNNL